MTQPEENSNLSPEQQSRLAGLLGEAAPNEREGLEPVVKRLISDSEKAGASSEAYNNGLVKLQRAIATEIDERATRMPRSHFFIKYAFSGVVGFAIALLFAGGYYFNNPDLVPFKDSGWLNEQGNRTMLALGDQEVRELPKRAFDNDIPDNVEISYDDYEQIRSGASSFIDTEKQEVGESIIIGHKAPGINNYPAPTAFPEIESQDSPINPTQPDDRAILLEGVMPSVTKESSLDGSENDSWNTEELGTAPEQEPIDTMNKDSSAAMPPATGGGNEIMSDQMTAPAMPTTDAAPAMPSRVHMVDTVYNFTGEMLGNIPENLVVYRVDNDKQTSASHEAITPILNALDNQVYKQTTDLDRFTISDNKDSGYKFEFNLESGEFFGYRDRADWSEPNQGIMPEPAPMPMPAELSPGSPESLVDIDPSTSTTNTGSVKPELVKEKDAIRIANQFLEDYGIDTKGLDKPLVEAAAGAGEVIVKYQKSIDGWPLFGWNGKSEGFLEVRINRYNHMIESIKGTLPSPLISSEYPAISAADAIEIAKQGGQSYGNIEPYPANSNSSDKLTINVDLNKMKLGYTRKHLLMPGGKNNQVYLVPVYVFNGTKTLTQGQSYPISIVVPAVDGPFYGNNTVTSSSTGVETFNTMQPTMEQAPPPPVNR